jgi:hypothetical protein
MQCPLGHSAESVTKAELQSFSLFTCFLICGKIQKDCHTEQNTEIKTELEDFARVPAYLIALLFAGRSKEIAILCRTHKLKQNYRVPIPGRSKKIAILRQST